MAGNIRQFDIGSDVGLRPDDRASSSTANAGRRISALYTSAAEANSDMGRRAASAIQDAGKVAVDYVTNREINRGAAESATALSALDQKWNATIKNADPNDPSVAAKFREEQVEPTLQALKDGFVTEGGQKFAEARIEQFRNHFNTKTASDMATMAGIAVRTNISTMTNQLSNMALTDPSSVKTSLKMVEDSVSHMIDSSPTLTGTDAARVKMEVMQASQAAIVKAAALGAINANPEAGLKQFSGPEYSKYLSGADLKAMEQQAKSVQRAERTDEAYRRTIEKQQKQDLSDEAENGYLGKLYSGDPKVAAEVTSKAIATDPKLSREARERMIGIVERQTKPETNSRISQQTFVNLLREMRDPNADPEKVMERAWDARLKDPGEAGSLTERDFNQFRQEMVARKTPEGAALEKDRAAFFKNYGQAIAGVGYTPQLGDPKIYKAEMDARRVENDLRKKGLDPHLAYDPSSEYFLGKDARIKSWAGSMQVDLGDRAAAAKADQRVTPPSLRGIADLDYSPSRKQYRDRTTGKIYDATGAEVK